MKRLHADLLFTFLLAVLLACWGCGRRDGREAAAQDGPKVEMEKGARLVIQLDAYMPDASGVSWANGGLDTLGDINGDGYADLVIGAGKYPGSFAAFSGKDGQEIWRVNARVGSAAKEAGELGYSFKDFALISDQNGDAVPEIFIRNNWTCKEAFIFSGKDGSRILRAQTERISTPVRLYDMNDDGVGDLVFVRGYKLAVQALSVKDLSETMKKEAILDLDPMKIRQEWLMPSYPDVDGDGIDEYLIGVSGQAEPEWLFVSGKDFSVIKRMPVPVQLASSSARLHCVGDLNSDSVEDLLVTKNIGAKADKDSSYLGVLSGADASDLWQIAGSSLPGGPTRIRVDAKTGERRELPGDVGFGDRPEILTDLNGDGAPEIACALETLAGGKSTRGVLIFSGATGDHLATLTLPPGQGRLVGKQMLFIEQYDPKGRSALAVSGKGSEKKYIVAVFDLPEIER